MADNQSTDPTPHLTDAQAAIFDQGWDAYEAGARRDSVPAFPDIEDRRWWLRGYYAAHRSVENE